jgi:hypothetical protein
VLVHLVMDPRPFTTIYERTGTKVRWDIKVSKKLSMTSSRDGERTRRSDLSYRIAICDRVSAFQKRHCFFETARVGVFIFFSFKLLEKKLLNG